MTYPSANESVAYTVCKIFTLLTINILAKGVQNPHRGGASLFCIKISGKGECMSERMKDISHTTIYN